MCSDGSSSSKLSDREWSDRGLGPALGRGALKLARYPDAPRARAERLRPRRVADRRAARRRARGVPRDDLSTAAIGSWAHLEHRAVDADHLDGGTRRQVRPGHRPAGIAELDPAAAPPDITYSFKHALVRDAAYESLLKSRRQQLHARIAAVLEERWPETKELQPELLARQRVQVP
jgi:hypothetical protein